MKFRKGFTLIELLTVVLILSVLTAIAVPQYHKAVKRAEAANMLINLRVLLDASKRYYAQTGAWPSSFSNLDVKLLLNSDSDNQSGEVKYQFYSAYRSVIATKVDSNGKQLFSLSAYYKYPPANPNGERDVFICKANNADKYQFVCDSLGSETVSDGTRVSAD